MRRAYEPIPWLATPNPPRVSATTGLGTRGGAGISSPIPGSGVGHVNIYTGTNPAVGGSVTLAFATAPPTLFVSGSEGLGPLVVTGQGTTAVTITWPLQPQRSTRQSIHYEWAVSQ